MISNEQVRTLIGGEVVDNTGNKIGKVGQVYLDDTTGAPEWATVKTGLFGTSQSFVPLAQASMDGDRLRVPYGHDEVKEAPRVEDDAHLSPQDEAGLYRHYGMSDTYGDTTGNVGTIGDHDRDGVSDDVEGRTVGYDTSGPTTDDAMTRSEERLNVGTEQVQAGRARLRKHIVTEQQQVTVPVTHEEVRVEREPITEGTYDKAMSGPELSEEEHEVVLTRERAVVTTEAVPVERVRLSKEQVQEQQTVSAEVRKERIELDGDVAGDSPL